MIKLIPIITLIFIFEIEKTHALRSGNLEIDPTTKEVQTFYCGGRSIDTRNYEKSDKNVRTNKLIHCNLPSGEVQGLLEQRNSDFNFNTITYRYFQDGLVKEVKVDQSKFNESRVKNIFGVNQNSTLDHFIPGHDNQDDFKKFFKYLGIKNPSQVTIAPNGIELLPTAKIWVMEPRGKNFRLKKIKEFFTSNKTLLVTEVQDKNNSVQTSGCNYTEVPQIFHRIVDDCDVKFCTANITCTNAGSNNIPAICKASPKNQCPANPEDCILEEETFALKN